MSLSERTLKGLKPGPARVRKSDGGGLYIDVTAAGKRSWRLSYRYGGKQKTLSLGNYPAVSLGEAREKREEAKTLLKNGHDPKTVWVGPKNVAKTNDVVTPGDTWSDIAKEYLQKRERQGAALPTVKKLARLAEKTMPSIGSSVARDLSPMDLLPILRREEALGHFETASRLRIFMGQVFRYAVATGRADSDPSRDLRDALVPPKAKHHAAIIEKSQVGGLMRAIRGYDKDPAIRAALLMMAYTFVRPGELRTAKWEDISAYTWTIPAERMKSKRKHVVALSRQAMDVLAWLKPHTEISVWIFPQRKNMMRPLSDGTMNAALRRLGFFSDEHVPHGFRTTASTNLNEAGWNSDWVEAQLAHVPSNQVRAAYNAAKYMDGRVEMMQWWADWLDEAEQMKPR